MGLLKGPVTFSRYLIAGAQPERFSEFFDDRIRRNAFRAVWRTSDETVAGWTSVENGLDTDFAYASYAQGRYLLFSLRIDRKSIAPSLLRLRILDAERKQLSENGQKKLYREQREAIRESVRLDLLGKILPVPAFHEICWSVSDRILTFCCLSDKIAAELQRLFKESFSLDLCPYAPGFMQETVTNPNGAITVTNPTTITPPSLPPDIDPLTVGREFLTWLWFKSEERNGMIRLSSDTETEVIFVRRLVLESGNGEFAETIVCQGLHADLKEGKEALRQGKKISAARLRMGYDNAEWEFTFKADRFHFQSMKLPAVAENEGEEIDREGQIIERIYLIEKASSMMDRLFRLFLDLRLSGQWETEQNRMIKWITHPQNAVSEKNI